MTSNSLTSQVGIGATAELSLRVSVAALARLLFEHPQTGELMLALERRATVDGARRSVKVKSQPFGGALRLYDVKALQNLIGDFRFDCEESICDQDFRIFIQPSAWGKVREFCLEQFSQPNNLVLESDPVRELTEEFAETLGFELKPDQYTSQAVGTIVEDLPSPTENAHARGYATTRIYRIFEVRMMDPFLASAMLDKSESLSEHDLRELVLQNSRTGGPGRANTVLILPFNEIRAAYAAISPEARTKPISFHGHQLDETVAAVLDDMTVSKYQRL
jgi:hypothetical protein